jgi:cytochrome c-type biogenesis protein CcmH
MSMLCALLALSSAQQVEVDRRVFEIARQLRCPVCVSESVADSDAAISIEMRNLIQEQIELGSSDAEIYAFFQARYGDWILLNPPRRGIHLLVWVLPVAAAVFGVGLLVWLMRRWTARSQDPVEASDSDIARVRELMERG